MEKKLPLLFHTGDVMMAHSLSPIVTNQIKFLDKDYGQKEPLTLTRGKVHEYLGMTVDFRNQGSALFNQFDAIKKFWNILPDYLHGVH